LFALFGFIENLRGFGLRKNANSCRENHMTSDSSVTGGLTVTLFMEKEVKMAHMQILKTHLSSL